MIQAKTIFIIPGYRHTPTYSAYKRMKTVLEKSGFQPIVINVIWDRTITQNALEFVKVYKKIAAKKKYILGFSFGAMIAFLASTKVEVRGLILCSLSPYFKEDLPGINKTDLARINKIYHHDFAKLSICKLSKKTKAKQIMMLYGAREARALIDRVSETFEQINLKNKSLLPVRKTEHNIGDAKYLNKIFKTIKLLN